MAAIAKPQSVNIPDARRQGIDGWVLFSVLSLACIGFIMVYSSSIGQAYALNAGPLFFLKREILFTGVGLVALIVGARLDYKLWRTFSRPLAIGCLLLLIAVLMPHIGASALGAQRWFRIGFVSIQPSEITKLVLAIYMAHWLSTRGNKIGNFRSSSMPFGIMLGIACLLVLAQPDMGTATIIGVSMVAVYYIAGARFSHLVVGLGVSVMLALMALSVAGYRTARIAAWFDPGKYKATAGYQIIHSLYALGSGGLTGVGLGNSMQKYNLPAPYTDGIFAITAEELGFLGAATILALFVIFAYRGFKIAQNAPEAFGRLLAVGITSIIVVQAFLNIAVVSGVVPFTGVPLPFISFGGSSLITSMLSVGILLNISRQSYRPPTRAHSEDSDEEGPKDDANGNHRRQDRRPRLSGTGRRRVPAPALASSRLISQKGGRTGARLDG